MVNVKIIDLAFSPTRVKININDQVKWTWTGGAPHSTTSSGGLWDSGVHGTGFTFTNTFPNAGSFPYMCSVHPVMAGYVTVQAANVTNGTATIVVAINGNGTVTPNYNGQMLTIGKTYTMTAKPAVGNLFSNWTGSLTISTPALTFIMQTNTSFQANFVPSPFGTNNATYNGLFFDTNSFSAESAGTFTLALTPAGKFTGKFQQGATRLSFNGLFGISGTAIGSLSRPGKSTLGVALQLDPSNTDRITGIFTDGISVLNLVAARAAFDGRTRIAPQAGLYTMTIPGAQGTNSLPGGISYATFTVDTAGKIKLLGSLSDSTKIAQATAISKNGDWPFYVALYGGQGAIFGWLSFQTTQTNDLSGQIFWGKTNVPSSKFYPSFNFATTASGFRYHPPAPGQNVLGFANGTLELSGGDLPQPIINHISIGANNRVTNLSSNLLTLTFKSTTGSFSGKVTRPGSAQSVSFGGVVAPAMNTGFGYFLGTTQSGPVILEAAP